MLWIILILSFVMFMIIVGSVLIVRKGLLIWRVCVIRRGRCKGFIMVVMLGRGGYSGRLIMRAIIQ